MATTISGTGGLSPSALAFIVGQVSFFAMAAAPSGFLECDGRVVSRTQYAQLFSVIGTTYGAGNGTSTFAVPDLRGEFIRSADRGRGVDSGRVVGSAQSDEFKNHAHLYAGGAALGAGSGNSYAPQMGAGVYSTTNVGGGETRPRNVALLACVFTGV